MANRSARESLASYLTGAQAMANGRNYVINPSGFDNNSNISTGGTGTVARNTSTPLTANTDLALTLGSNATDYVQWLTNSLDKPLNGQNCELRFDYTASAIGTNVRAGVYIGGIPSVLSDPLVVTSIPKTVSVNSPCGDLADPTSLLIINYTGNTGVSSINVANVQYGRATNLGNVAQTQFIGSAYFADTSSCEWTRSSSSFGAFSTNSSCPGPTVEFNPGPGTILTTDTDLPQVTVNNLPPGNYQITATLRSNISTSGRARYQITDGTTTSGNVENQMDPSTTGITITTVGWFNYTTTGNRTFSIYGAASTGNVLLSNQAAGQQLKFSIVRYPSSSEIVYRPELQASSWSGYHDNTCSWARTNTALGDPTADASCVFTERTNRNFGTVTSALSGSDKLPGIVFTPIKAGRYFVSAKVQTLDNNSNNKTFSLTDGTNIIAYGGTNGLSNSQQSVTLTGILNVSSVSAVTLKVQSAITANTVTIQSPGANGVDPTAVEWSIFSLDQALPAPILVGSVTSNSTGAERIERANITNSGTPVVTSQSGTWITSITDNGTGDSTLNIASGIFSAAPSCVLSQIGTNGYARVDSSSSSAVRVVTTSTVPADADRNFYIVCVGPR